MALRSFALASATGFACSLWAGNNKSSALCDDRKTSGGAPPEQLNSAACKCVIIGGGYAGSKLAYYLDSVLDVTLIDEKNFFEMSYAVTPLLTRKWNDDEKDDLNSVAEFKKFSSIHRFYLKRANVVTGTASTVTENEVVLSDGRRVPYDLLFLATGAQKPFPFSSSQRTLAGRIDEVKNFNEFLKNKCKKVAIVGGGPAGAALAASLAEQQPDKDIVLFHSHDELCPSLPKTVRNAVLNSLTHIRQSTLDRKKVFKITGGDSNAEKAAEEAFAKGSLTIKLNHRVNSVEAMPNATGTIVAAPPSEPTEPVGTEGNQPQATRNLGFWDSIFGSHAKQGAKAQTFTNVPMKYRIIADELDSSMDESASAQQKLIESRSIFHRLYFGNSVPARSKYASVLGVASSSTSTSNNDMQQASSEDEDEMRKEVKAKISTIVKEGITFDDFDYVFDMRGSIPRPIVALPSDKASEMNILNSHVLPDGKYRSSLLLQLLGRPNIFALGKCNNLPWANSAKMSETQAKTIFTALMNILMFSDPANPKLMNAATDGIQPKKMIIPTIMLPLGTFEAAGFSSQKGIVTGPSAMVEIKADFEHSMRDFISPVFFKQRDQRESKNRIMCWLNEEITEVTDFCF